MKHPALILLLLALGLGGCIYKPTTQRAELDSELVKTEQEKQREISINYTLRLYQRLYRLGHPLLTAAAPLCKEDQGLHPGWLLATRHDYRKDMQEAAGRLLDIDDRLMVLYVAPASPAEQAGILTGDRLLHVGTHQVAKGKGAEKALNSYLKEQPPEGNLMLTIERDGETRQLSLPKEQACHYGLVISGSDDVNAYADGSNVGITKGMMRFAESDQELSLVIAHEIAHNTMEHVSAKRSNAFGGLILDILAAAAGVNTQGVFQQISANAYSQEFEAEADYIGLYIMARAGLSLEGSADFWRRMAAEHPASISTNHAATHPASAARFVAIENTIGEIASKRAGQNALIPEFKE